MQTIKKLFSLSSFGILATILNILFVTTGGAFYSFGIAAALFLAFTVIGFSFMYIAVFVNSTILIHIHSSLNTPTPSKIILGINVISLFAVIWMILFILR
jgi:hypothetical protein